MTHEELKCRYRRVLERIRERETRLTQELTPREWRRIHADLRELRISAEELRTWGHRELVNIIKGGGA